MANLPEPLVPPYVDLGSFDCMPLDVRRLLNADIMIEARAEELKYALILWARSWHQVPAASLPSEEKKLAHLVGLGTDVKKWRKVQKGALRGFVRCTDGRLYHPLIAEKANESWKLKRRGKAGAEARWSLYNSLKSHESLHAQADAQADAQAKLVQSSDKNRLDKRSKKAAAASTTTATPPSDAPAWDEPKAASRRAPPAAPPAAAASISKVEVERTADTVAEIGGLDAATQTILRDVTEWMRQGYAADAIVGAARKIFATTKNIRNWPALLSKAMPDRLKLNGHSDEPTPEQARIVQRKILIRYYSSKERRWRCDEFPPGDPQCKFPSDIIADVKRELGINDG